MLNRLLTTRVALSVCAPLLAAAPAMAGNILTNGKLTVGFATGRAINKLNGNRVDSITWINSAGVSTGNLAVASSGRRSTTCTDPTEFFGQSIGGPSDTTPPYLVTSGDVDGFIQMSDTLGGVAKVSNLCGHSSALANSGYQVFTQAGAINELQVTRQFAFSSTTPVFASNLRAYIPRLSSQIYATDLIPDTHGVVQSYAISACTSGCAVPWNNSWIAEDNGAGSGMVIIRSSFSHAQAIAVVDFDPESKSNASNVTLVQPVGGFKAPVIENEYLCFYDPQTWTAASRNAGQLPTGCSLP